MQYLFSQCWSHLCTELASSKYSTFLLCVIYLSKECEIFFFAFYYLNTCLLEKNKRTLVSSIWKNEILFTSNFWNNYINNLELLFSSPKLSNHYVLGTVGTKRKKKHACFQKAVSLREKKTCTVIEALEDPWCFNNGGLPHSVGTLGNEWPGTAFQGMYCWSCILKRMCFLRDKGIGHIRCVQGCRDMEVTFVPITGLRLILTLWYNCHCPHFTDEGKQSSDNSLRLKSH